MLTNDDILEKVKVLAMYEGLFLGHPFLGLSIRTRLFWVIAAVTSSRWAISPLTITNSRKSAKEPQYDLTVPGLNFYKILAP